MCESVQMWGTYGVLGPLPPPRGVLPGPLAPPGGVLLGGLVPPAQGELPDEDRAPVVGRRGDLETDDLGLTSARGPAPLRRVRASWRFEHRC